jgi:hypothetical protein
MPGKQLTDEEVKRFTERGRRIVDTSVFCAIGALDEELTALTSECDRLGGLVASGRMRRRSLSRRVKELEKLIRWALGESPLDLPDFPSRQEGEGLFYWRKKLAKLAQLPERDRDLVRADEDEEEEE